MKRLLNVYSIVLLFALTIILLTSCQSNQTVLEETNFADAPIEGQLSVRFFNLEGEDKTGDAFLVTSPDGMTMLIDSGHKKNGAELAKKLEDYQVSDIDIAVATHMHIDHIGGYLTLIDHTKINRFVMPNVPHSTNTYQTFMKKIEDHDIPVDYTKENDQFSLGEDISIEVLNPPETELETLTHEQMNTPAYLNNRSLVLKLTYKNHQFLFTGDLYKEQEALLVEKYGDKLNAHVVQAPHHGDNTSSSPSFVKAIQPDYTVISSNILQNKGIYDRYRNHDSEVFVTGVDGEILIVSNGEEIHTFTEKERKGTYLQ
ncbi:ComEC/Rec2 family competence protein [Alkalihalobacillus sp. BA299]|uniref:ComEC/Rec2 family competence protein n=1 Tax=Alkalihalobacillus sp. BA299 TaxID=2815938 RepID=UPI001ADC3997|nr:MBL fold metallo-hydrolase [Alkalihalobacillus sp. BA299]